MTSKDRFCINNRHKHRNILRIGHYGVLNVDCSPLYLNTWSLVNGAVLEEVVGRVNLSGEYTIGNKLSDFIYLTHVLVAPSLRLRLRESDRSSSRGAQPQALKKGEPASLTEPCQSALALPFYLLHSSNPTGLQIIKGDSSERPPLEYCTVASSPILYLLLQLALFRNGQT